MPTAKQRVEAAEQRLFHRYGLDVTTHEVTVSQPPLPMRVLEVPGDRGVPLLFLHGVGEVSSQWAPLWAQLEDRRCIGVDLPGFGLSAEVDFHRVDLRPFGVATVRAVLDAFELDSAVLVGNSLGGACAVWTALDAPQRVSALALLGSPDPAVPGSRVSLPLAAMGVPVVNRFVLSLPVPPLAVNRAMYKLNLGSEAIEHSPSEIVEVAHHAMDRPTFAGSMSSYMERVFHFRRPKQEFVLSTEELAKLSVPTLIVWGDHDAFGPVRVARRLAGRLPDAVLEEVEGGHNPWLDRPDVCAERLASFLAAHDL